MLDKLVKWSEKSRIRKLCSNVFEKNATKQAYKFLRGILDEGVAGDQIRAFYNSIMDDKSLTAEQKREELVNRASEYITPEIADEMYARLLDKNRSRGFFSSLNKAFNPVSSYGNNLDTLLETANNLRIRANTPAEFSGKVGLTGNKKAANAAKCIMKNHYGLNNVGDFKQIGEKKAFGLSFYGKDGDGLAGIARNFNVSREYQNAAIDATCLAAGINGGVAAAAGRKSVYSAMAAVNSVLKGKFDNPVTNALGAAACWATGNPAAAAAGMYLGNRAAYKGAFGLLNKWRNHEKEMCRNSTVKTLDAITSLAALALPAVEVGYAMTHGLEHGATSDGSFYHSDLDCDHGTAHSAPQQGHPAQVQPSSGAQGSAVIPQPSESIRHAPMDGNGYAGDFGGHIVPHQIEGSGSGPVVPPGDVGAMTQPPLQVCVDYDTHVRWINDGSQDYNRGLMADLHHINDDGTVSAIARNDLHKALLHQNPDANHIGVFARDFDHDGTISSDEIYRAAIDPKTHAATFHLSKEHLTAMDSNHDGTIDRNEFWSPDAKNNKLYMGIGNSYKNDSTCTANMDWLASATNTRKPGALMQSIAEGITRQEVTHPIHIDTHTFAQSELPNLMHNSDVGTDGKYHTISDNNGIVDNREELLRYNQYAARFAPKSVSPHAADNAIIDYYQHTGGLDTHHQMEQILKTESWLTGKPISWLRKNPSLLDSGAAGDANLWRYLK